MRHKRRCSRHRAPLERRRICLGDVGQWPVQRRLTASFGLSTEKDGSCETYRRSFRRLLVIVIRQFQITNIRGLQPALNQLMTRTESRRAAEMVQFPVRKSVTCPVATERKR